MHTAGGAGVGASSRPASSRFPPRAAPPPPHRRAGALAQLGLLLHLPAVWADRCILRESAAAARLGSSSTSLRPGPAGASSASSRHPGATRRPPPAPPRARSRRRRRLSFLPCGTLQTSTYRCASSTSPQCGRPAQLGFLLHLPAARAGRRVLTSSSISSGRGRAATQAPARPPR
jgi:hypothetical protein